MRNVVPRQRFLEKLDRNIQHPPREPQRRQIHRANDLVSLSSSTSKSDIEIIHSPWRLQRLKPQPRPPQAGTIRLGLCTYYYNTAQHFLGDMDN